MRTHRLLALAGLLPLLAAGCGDARERELASMPPFCQEVLPAVDAWVASQEQPRGDRYGGTAVVGGIGEIPGGMNGLVSADHAANQHQLFVNLMSLVRLDEALEPRPWLAESWSWNDEGTALTFRLRTDVFWHDGTPTTARDVAFTFRRANDPGTGFPNQAFWARYPGGPDAVEVLDDHTVRFHLEPHPEPLDSWRALPILPAHLLEDVPAEELAQHPFGTRCPVGNGPFVFLEHRPDASWTFVRNPGFPEALGGPPYLERYVYRVIPEPTTLLAELLTGAVDVYLQPLPDQLPRIQDDPGARILATPFRELTFVVWNSRRPHLEDARVRRALTLGVNRREILEAMRQGYGTVANASVPPFHYGHHGALVDSLPFDPEGARRLLDQAGWGEMGADGVRRNAQGERLEITVFYNQGNRARQEIAEIMQAQLGDVGVAVNPRVLEYSAMVDRVLSPEKDFDAMVLGWVTEFKVDDHDLFHSRAVDGLYAFSGTRNTRLDTLIDSLQVVTDREEALPLWHAYQEELVREQPYTFLYFPDRLMAVSGRLEGATFDVRGEWAGIGAWWIPADARRRR